MTKRDLWIGFICFGWGTAIAISIVNHFFSFWSLSLWLRALYLGIGIPFCSLVVYWLFWWKLYPVLGGDLYRLGGVSLILGLAIIFFVDIWANVVPMPPQQLLVLEVSGQRDPKSNGGEVWLYEIKDTFGKKVPFSKLEREGDWQQEDGFLIAWGDQPSKLSFIFTLNPERDLQLLFLSHPEGGIVEISAGKRQEVINLFQIDRGDTLITIEANNSLVDWRIRLLLYTADALVFALALLLLLTLISKSSEAQLVLSRLSTSMKTKQFRILIDGSVVLIFIFISFIYTIGRTGDSFSRMSLLNGDAANIASFAAALDHPDLFSKDPLLSNPDNFAFYFTIHVPMIRLLNHVFGNYGTAFISLLFPILFAQLMGFYYLGNVLYHNRFWAFLLAIVTAVSVTLPLGEFWGFYVDPIPRLLFQAFLPFLLGAAIKWGGQAKFWPWIMGCAGLLVYAHPVSAPAWGVAILLGLWFSVPSSITSTHRFKMMIMSGLFFLIVITPFAVNYLTTFSHSQAKDYDQVMEILSYRFSPGYLNLPLALQIFYQEIINSNLINRGLWIWTGVGFGLVTYLQKKNSIQNRYSYVLASWWIGLLLISVALPLIEHEALKALRRTPLEFDLIRGLRYTIPLLWMVSFWALSEVYNVALQTSRMYHFGDKLWSLLVAIAGIGMVFFWMNENQFISRTNISSTYACWKQELFLCPQPEATARADFLDAIRVLTPPGSSIFYSDLAVRYYALRSITYTNKDGGALGYANHDELIKWYKQNQELVAISAYTQNKSLVLKAYLEFARSYGSDYFVLQPVNDMFNEVNPLELKLIYRNSYGSLYEIIR